MAEKGKKDCKISETKKIFGINLNIKTTTAITTLNTLNSQAGES